MDQVFSILDSLPDKSLIILTILFDGCYNISIGKRNNYITLLIYDSINRDIIRYNGTLNATKYINLKNYIIQQVGEIPITYINGISSITNKQYLSNYFNIKPNNFHNLLINFNKKFI